MTTTSKQIEWARLHEPFPADDVEWRLQQVGKNERGFWGKCLAYITNRAIMERLDSVIGPGDWRNEFTGGPSGGVLCGISVRVDGEWVTKWDGAENTDIESVKGGLSNAMKRAAVQWGIGRYLYDLEEGWANCHADQKQGRFQGKTKENQYFSWDPPELPAWALPGGAGKPSGTAPTPKAPRPTREQPKPSEEPAGDFDRAAFLASVASGKQAKGRTWNELLTDEDGRGYVRWAVQKMARLSFDQKQALDDALNKVLASPVTVVQLQDLLNTAARVQAITIEESAKVEQVIDRADPDELARASAWLNLQIEKKKLQP